ncbi:MAG: hypothetical protein IBJ18_04030 [Phycisphaerales bacterium]|nr:hypothetical protein [Phycisphaerales bacterium]
MFNRSGRVAFKLVGLVVGVSVVGFAVVRSTGRAVHSEAIASSIIEQGPLTAAQGVARLGISPRGMAMAGVGLTEAVSIANAAREAVPEVYSASRNVDRRDPRATQSAADSMRAAWIRERDELIGSVGAERAVMMKRYDSARQAGVPTPAGVVAASDPGELKKYARAVRRERRAARMGTAMNHGDVATLSSCRENNAANTLMQRLVLAPEIAQQIRSAN